MPGERSLRMGHSILAEEHRVDTASREPYEEEIFQEIVAEVNVFVKQMDPSLRRASALHYKYRSLKIAVFLQNSQVP